MQTEAIKRAREYIKEADALLITAGAGMGVDSGLPDFRGSSGFWKAYPAIKDLGYSFVEMANPRWFKNKPALAWAFYGHRLNLYRETKPHKGFDMLLELGGQMRDGYFIFTSNVDGHFQTAGFDKERIYECHGAINHFQCTKNCTKDIWDAKNIQIEVDMEIFKALNFPLCPRCGAVSRPNILMFGDWNWNSSISDYQEMRLGDYLERLRDKESKIVIIEMGAGKAIPTVRMFSENIAEKPNAKLIRINPRDTSIDDRWGVSIELGALEGLRRILE